MVVALVAADGEAYGSEKGEKKTIKITLGDKTVASLNKADTALQTVKIMGTDIDIDDDGYTEATKHWHLVLHQMLILQCLMQMITNQMLLMLILQQ